jgi:hypothetical protein
LPFGKNLSQTAPAAPSPCPKGRWPALLPDHVITVACLPFASSGFSFSYHQHDFFAILAPAMRVLKITM